MGRNLWLYDTFEGMTPPTSVDIDIQGTLAQSLMDQYADNGKWCYAPMDAVRETFRADGFVDDNVHLIAGDVVQTLRQSTPETIAILRLDTDWS